MSTPYLPEGFTTITPYLIVPDAQLLVDFLKKAFDAKEHVLMRTDDGKISHACFEVAGSKVELATAQSQWQPMTAGLHVYVPDVDAAYKRAIDAGATSLYDPADMFYGERSGGIKDPAGNHWYLATFKEKLSDEEIEKRHAEWEQKRKVD